MENGERRHLRDNPHKYLLYKPSISQLLVFLASGFKELPPAGKHGIAGDLICDSEYRVAQFPIICRRIIIVHVRGRMLLDDQASRGLRLRVRGTCHQP